MSLVEELETFNGRTALLTVPCMVCGLKSRLMVPEDGWRRYKAGAFVQDAFPMLSIGDRELIISGTHSACFDKAFPPEDDE